jgi:hypothetical protein
MTWETERGWVAILVYCAACSSSKSLAEVRRYDDGTTTLMRPMRSDIPGIRPKGGDLRRPQRGETALTRDGGAADLWCPRHGERAMLDQAELLDQAAAVRPGAPLRYSY